MRGKISLTVAALFLIAVAGVIVPRAVARAQDDTLIVGLAEEADSLDNAKTFAWPQPFWQIYDTLMTHDGKGNILPALATDWNVLEGGKVIEVKLREGVTFHDGTPFNAEAVKFNFDHFIETDAPAAYGLGNYESTEVVDEHTARIHFKQAWAPFFNAEVWLQIASPTAIQKWGEDYSFHPSGTGPFMLEEWVPKDHLTLVRFDDYKNAEPYVENKVPKNIKRLIYRIIPEEGTMVAALETGEIHVLFEVPLTEYVRLKENPDIVMVQQPAAGIHYVGFNTQRPPYDNITIRQALSYALDREQIMEAGFEKNAVAGAGLFPPGIVGYDENAGEYGINYDPEKAKALLKDAGYEDTDGDGILEKDGQPFDVEIWATEAGHYQRMAQVVQSELMDVGVNASIKTTDQSTLLASTSKGIQQLFLMDYWDNDPNIVRYFFHTSQLPSSNRILFISGVMDDWLARGEAEMDLQKRVQIYKDIQKILLHDAAWYPLGYKFYIRAYNKAKVTGIRFTDLMTERNLLVYDAQKVK